MSFSLLADHTPPLFAADSIGKTFGRHTVLEAASIWGHAGRITALLGRNGCGKSTLLRIGVGLLRADYGVVLFDGRAYLRARLPALAARGLFYLPERGLLSTRLPVGDQLRAIAWRFGETRAPAALERLELAAIAGRAPLDLSSGETRRAELAAALMRAPRCLVADEPFAGIDPVDSDRVTAALRALAAAGCAVIVTGHEVPQVLDVAHDVVWMVAGTTHHLGTPADALRHAQFAREYVGAEPRNEP